MRDRDLRRRRAGEARSVGRGRDHGAAGLSGRRAAGRGARARPAPG
jgi:hypothetical protein